MRAAALDQAWKPDAWVLAGRGGCAVVVRDGCGRVLRLLAEEAAQQATAEDEALECELWGHLPGFAGATGAARSWLFARHVLAPLLGCASTTAGTLVRPPATFLRLLESRLGPGCPRLAGEAVLLPDLANLQPWRAGTSPAPPVFAVELKPKCGFLPQAAAVEPRSVKRHSSRFQLHQRLKLAHGRVTQLSHYCPLQLFSGDPDRVAGSLRGLLATPQNNFAVSRDGELVFGGAGGRTMVRANFPCQPFRH